MIRIDCLLAECMKNVEGECTSKLTGKGGVEPNSFECAQILTFGLSQPIKWDCEIRDNLIKRRITMYSLRHTQRPIFRTFSSQPST